MHNISTPHKSAFSSLQLRQSLLLLRHHPIGLLPNHRELGVVDCHNDAGSAGALVAAADGLDGVAGVLGVVGSILAMELHLNNNIAPINLLFRSRFILAN